MSLRLHVDDSELLRESITYTAGVTGFNARLVEKDYFCSVTLAYLAAQGTELTFKGGTCLSKIHGDMYRLSEDLDFSISTPADATRAVRSRQARPIKDLLIALPEALPGFLLVEPLASANNSSQYNAAIAYESVLDGHSERISIEVGVREPVVLERLDARATTVLLHPINGERFVAPFPVAALDYQEAMAEKVRAALCRRHVAIRDYFDLDHAVQNGRLDPRRPAFLDLARRKLQVPGTRRMDISDTRMGHLRSQQEAQLRSVLREREFEQFDLERAVTTVRAMAGELTSS